MPYHSVVAASSGVNRTTIFRRRAPEGRGNRDLLVDIRVRVLDVHVERVDAVSHHADAAISYVFQPRLMHGRTSPCELPVNDVLAGRRRVERTT